jgi:hypothetical protein
MVKYTLQNSRKKTTKRKTTRRKVAGTFVDMAKKAATPAYRALHKATLRKPSVGEQGEIDAKERELKRAAREEKRKRDNDLLDKIRKSDDYTEMEDIKDLKKGETYVEFQGADEKPNLFKLGTFQRLEEEPYKGPFYGVPINAIFDNKKLTGLFRRGAERWLVDNTSIKGLIFKVNTANILKEDKRLPDGLAEKIASYGGRKRKTKRRSIKKQRKTKKSRRSRRSRK